MTHPYIYAGLTDKKQLMSRMGRHTDDVQTIINITSAILGIELDQLYSPNRKREVSEARCIAIGLIFSVNETVTLKQIGKIFNRDHSTIIYNRDLFNDLMGIDKGFTEKANQVLKLV